MTFFQNTLKHKVLIMIYVENKETNQMTGNLNRFCFETIYFHVINIIVHCEKKYVKRNNKTPFSGKNHKYCIIKLICTN